MKTIRVLSESLGISKEAIYKKMKQQLKTELEGHIIKVNNVTHIDDIGEQIIINSLNRERQEVIQDMMNVEDTNDHKIAVLAEEQPHVKEYVHILQEQIKTKDIQLAMQNNHITQLINQVGNHQLLLRGEQYKDIVSLQSQWARKEPVAGKPSLWKRIFKK